MCLPVVVKPHKEKNTYTVERKYWLIRGIIRLNKGAGE